MMPEVRGEETAGGLLVLGMHRSGTSLVAGSLHLLGLATCASYYQTGEMIEGKGRI